MGIVDAEAEDHGLPALLRLHMTRHAFSRRKSGD